MGVVDEYDPGVLRDFETIVIAVIITLSVISMLSRIPAIPPIMQFLPKRRSLSVRPASDVGRCQVPTQGVGRDGLARHTSRSVRGVWCPT